ncbi:MAG TPA: FAD:protein FMN transferase [Chthoniobacterales bacterium]|jgi:thiamine biosynthesis lipoprotein|nr:FAD:protein FMN transferase [Chthoniobacterales bacterium]
MKSVSSEVRRARPLLGTFVEITAQGRDETTLHRAINDAFAAVRQVHDLMSYHDPESDVSRLNRHGFVQNVTVHPWTWQVLQAAGEFSRQSGGVFDITVAPELTRRNYLPPSGYDSDASSTWRDVSLGENGRTFFRRRATIDLGGIAKGFAVDRAVEALVAGGAQSGIVNAGGDLRVFGPEPRLVHIRHAQDSRAIGGAIMLRESSLATSALYGREGDHRQTGALIDGRTGCPALGPVSVSVYAPDCMTADALTKIVLALRDDARPILDRYRAGAFIFVGDSSFCELRSRQAT